MRPGCPRPLELPTLADYWFGDLPGPEAEAAEEHLFACAGCSERLRALADLGEGVRTLARRGAVPTVVTPSFLETAARAGLRVREYAVAPGGRVACTVTPEDDLLVSRLRADLTGVSRLDVLGHAEGEPESRVSDVPFSPEAGEVIMAQAMPRMRGLGRTVVHFRLVAREGDGERVLGDYVFDHAPSTEAR